MPNQSLDRIAGPHPELRIDRGHRIYAIGDVHGRVDLLRRLHDAIRADRADQPSDRITVVHLGDYVDRGPDSAAVLELLSGDPIDDVEAVYLRGNHEQFMMDFIDTGARGAAWIANGGAETMASYGVTPDPWDPSVSSRTLRDAIPTHHCAFLDRTALMHRIGDVVFAHAGVDPHRPLDAQRPEDLLWIREKFLGHTEDLGVVVVHGHTPRPDPEVTRGRINVDTHAWHSGRLTAAVIEMNAVRFLSTT